ncbi:MAG: hypothetical protein HPM95_05595 [Alphaproteobacteria bacterium]|nr:hypothetical protein [Alphaproteobacteria bacterium]
MLATAGAGLSLRASAGVVRRWRSSSAAFCSAASAPPLYSLSAAHANDHARPGISLNWPPA